jgi:hypothetical protein
MARANRHSGAGSGDPYRRVSASLGRSSNAANRCRPEPEVMMSLLICRPVSHRSHPEKIRLWIQNLEQKREEHRSDPDAVETLEQCIRQAKRWVED